MTTWISKGGLLAGALLGLGACDGMPLQLGNALDGLLPGAEVENVALSQTLMAQGAFTLFPPEGFCVDRNTLRQDFALMARCDTLGAPNLALGAPVALITLGVTPLIKGEIPPTPEEIAQAATLDGFSDVRSDEDTTTFLAEGDPPARGLDRAHWRGVTRVGDNVVGVALYGPAEGRAVSAEGRDILNSLIRRLEVVD